MSKQVIYDKVDILGVGIDVISLGEAIDYICSYAKDPRSTAAYVIKPYVEFLDKAANKPALLTLLNEAQLAIADGVAVIWAAHFLYAGPRTLWRFWLTLGQIITAPAALEWPILQRAAGSTFTWPLLRAASAHQLRIFIIGKESDAAVAAVSSRIAHEVPGISIVGTASGRDHTMPRGQVGPAWIAQTATRIEGLQADLVFVGMGFPLQEQVCAILAQRLQHGLLVGEGGTFDYESFGGKRRKAPKQLQRVGLEWLWRLGQEPKRIIRQLAIPRFIFKIWKSR